MAEPGKVAYVFPGQGAQFVGMGRDLYDGYAAARAVFDEADDVLGFPLSRLCFEGPEDELVQTKNAQPALVTVSYACLEAMREAAGGNSLPYPAFVAGHSLGEYTALAAAGVLDFARTVYLARERGRLMHEAGQQRPGGMVAVLGLDEEALSKVCQESGAYIANINCPGQVAISGAEDDINRAAELARAAGASRTVRLQVSGAFHTPLMQPAADGMAEVMDSMDFRQPQITVVGNTSAGPLTAAEEVPAELLKQLCHCVQWQRSVEYMIASGITTFVEIGPGRVLTGLIKRTSRDVGLVNVGDVKAVNSYIEAMS